MIRFIGDTLIPVVGFALLALWIVLAVILALNGCDAGPTQHDFRAACRYHNGVRAYDDGHLICLDGGTPELP